MRALDREHTRPVLESEIERLIDMLDTMDDDPDLESTGDEEPWLGAPAGMHGNGHGTNWHGSSLGDDREEVCEDEGAQCDDEGEHHGDAEPDYDGEGTGNHQGPCSPVETMLGGNHAN